MRWCATKWFPEEAWKKLKARAKQGNAEIANVRVATAREIEVARETGTSAEYINETEFVIQGLSAVRDYQILRKVSHGLIQGEMEDFTRLNPDTMTFAELSYWNKWAWKLSGKIENLESIHDQCVRFLAQEHITSIHQLKHKL